MTDLRRPEDAERLEAEAPDEYLKRRDFLQRTALTAGLAMSMATVLDPGTLVAEAARRQARVPLPNPRNAPIDHFVVIMMENRSFDHYLGWLPNADARNAGLSYEDKQGREQSTRNFAPDFQGCAHPDPDHGWDDCRIHINGGKMDGFLKSKDNDEFAISYYGERDIPFIPSAARAFTTFDRFFCSLAASTFPNREYMWAAQSYGHKDNKLPSDTEGNPDNTIMDALEARGIPARYFYNDLPVSGLWGRQGLARSSRVDEYYLRCEQGTLPALSFVDPVFSNEGGGTSGDEHPHGDIRTGQAFMADVVLAFMESPHWERGALFIVYDEWGGFFDHVAPPRVPDDRNSRDVDKDFGQMGIRIPAVGVSPHVRRGHVDHGTYGFESILKMIRWRYGLPPLTKRDRFARNIARAFDWQSPPRVDRPALPDPPNIVSQQCPNRSPSLLDTPRRPGEARASASPPRPKPHDLSVLLTSGYLDRLGFDYRPATPGTTFREPSKVTSAYRPPE
jgi:phospholipase C